ncbi:MAG: hypothetical protein H0W24_00610 [Lysobacter sp.]|nr:hypothetical protein [Lysobacter sp.]MDQ3269803.1 hypothetical protein [Pseudomonadota bacterium]
MEIQQKRFASRIGFVFADDELRYSIKDSSGRRSFSLPYVDISRDRQTLEERSQWLCNVGLLWIALGAVFTATAWFTKQQFAPSLWLLIGGGCYVAYRMCGTAFTILPTEKGNLLVIDDKDGPRVIEEIEARRAAQLREQYDYLDPGESLEQQRNRYKWLHREGALGDEELQQRLLGVGLDDSAVIEVERLAIGQRLN